MNTFPRKKILKLVFPMVFIGSLIVEHFASARAPSPQPSPSYFPDPYPSTFPSTLPFSYPSTTPSGGPSEWDPSPQPSPSYFPYPYPSAMPSAHPFTYPSASPSAEPVPRVSSVPRSRRRMKPVPTHSAFPGEYRDSNQSSENEVRSGE